MSFYSSAIFSILKNLQDVKIKSLVRKTIGIWPRGHFLVFCFQTERRLAIRTLQVADYKWSAKWWPTKWWSTKWWPTKWWPKKSSWNYLHVDLISSVITVLAMLHFIWQIKSLLHLFFRILLHRFKLKSFKFSLRNKCYNHSKEMFYLSSLCSFEKYTFEI